MRILAVLLLVFFWMPVGSGASEDGKVAFHPERWPAEELRAYLRLQSGSPVARREIRRRTSLAGASRAMIGAADFPFATHIGLKVLQGGGNSADAAIATSLAQSALSAGASVSYAGIMNVVYYDAATHQVYALNAGFNTVQSELEPLSIPRREPSGRTALIPGYMAGIAAFHQRFGSIAWRDLVAPAIWIAEQGVPLSHPLAGQIQHNRELLSRSPETKQIFTTSNGAWLASGEIFRQPALAQTLKAVAAEGASYMYEGQWARNFVAAVNRIGGKVTMSDMTAYRADWTTPARISYRDREVVSIGNGHRGASVALGSLKAAERAQLRKHGHFASSAESLWHLIRISRIHMQMSAQSPKQEAENSHTAPIVVVDAKGNVASLVPTVMMGGWGHTGLFVDGVAIPDSAKFLQPSIARAGPGTRLSDPTTPILILRAGKPEVAFGSLGGNGVPTLVLQSLVSVLEFDMDVATAAAQPYTLGGYLSGTGDKAAREREVILIGSFPSSVLDQLRALGQPLQLMQESQQEAWSVAIQIGPAAGELKAGASKDLPALFESY